MSAFPLLVTDDHFYAFTLPGAINKTVISRPSHAWQHAQEDGKVSPISHTNTTAQY
jgi:hypothetical protein